MCVVGRDVIAVAVGGVVECWLVMVDVGVVVVLFVCVVVDDVAVGCVAVSMLLLVLLLLVLMTLLALLFALWCLLSWLLPLLCVLVCVLLLLL